VRIGYISTMLYICICTLLVYLAYIFPARAVVKLIRACLRSLFKHFHLFLLLPRRVPSSRIARDVVYNTTYTGVQYNTNKIFMPMYYVYIRIIRTTQFLCFSALLSYTMYRRQSTCYSRFYFYVCIA